MSFVRHKCKLKALNFISQYIYYFFITVWYRSYGVIYHYIDRIDLLIAHVHLDNGYVTHAEGISCYLIFVDLYLIVCNSERKME